MAANSRLPSIRPARSGPAAPGLDRRTFLSLLGTGAAAALLPGCGGSDGGGSADRVIVIGAGVAGLTLANALTTAGMETVVLEGRDRLGGRVHTAEFGGAPVDFGGAWISGPDGNPAACVLAREGIGWRSAEPVDAGVTVYDARLDRVLSIQELVGAFLSVLTYDESIPELQAALGPLASVADAIEKVVDDLELTGDGRRWALDLMRINVESLFAAPAESLALSAADTSLAFPGGEHFPDGGYAGLIAALARGVDVRFDTRVTRVEHDERGVVVETSRGIYRASHVVVTVPLGVLRSAGIEFSPALPERKQVAIDRLAMGVLEKVALRFDEAFWQAPGRTNFVYLSRTPGEFPFFVDLSPYTGEPIIVTLYCGSFSRRAAQMSEDELIGRAAEVVSVMAGVEARQPTEGRATRWQLDPYALGSYSYIPIGGSIADMEALAAPVGERLLFAGEATSSLYYGYVHGAVVSGAREATRLLGGADPVLESGVVAAAGCGATV